MSTEPTSAGHAVQATDALDQNTNQETPVKTFTQTEVDNMIAGMKGALSKRLLKPYEDLGDIEELRQLRQQHEQAQQESAVKRGEFDRVLQELAVRKDAEIAKRDKMIQEYRVDVPLVQAAAQARSHNPEQVRTLLRNQVRLNTEGEVEVVTNDGQVRYQDSGKPLGVEDLVGEFLSANPHFVQATPATTNSRSNISATIDKVDLSQLDMRLAEHRKLYAQARASKKV